MFSNTICSADRAILLEDSTQTLGFIWSSLSPTIERERITFPEFLQASGYRTAMFGSGTLANVPKREGNVAIGGTMRILPSRLQTVLSIMGLIHFWCFRSHGTSGPDGQKKNTPTQRIGPAGSKGDRFLVRRVTGKTDGSYQLHEVGRTLDKKALNFLEQAASETQPFFVYFASPSNHSPYTPSGIGEYPIVGASTFKSVSRQTARGSTLCTKMMFMSAIT